MLNFLIIIIPIKSLELLASTGMIISLLQFISNKKTKENLLINIIVMFLFIFFMIGIYNKIEIAKYLYSIMLVYTSYVFLSRSKHEKILQYLYIISSLLFLIVCLEHTWLRGYIHQLFRNSVTIFHAERETGVFLYPGDLGAASAILISIFFYNYVEKNEGRKKNILFILILSILIIFSQSRMAVFHFLLSIVFFTNFRMLKILVFIFSLVFLILFYRIIEIKYFELTFDFFEKYGFELISSNSPLKRVQELYTLKNALFGLDYIPHDFYESGVVSLYFSLGIVGLSFYIICILFVTVISYRADIKLLGIVVPLFVTNLVSAPFDRPKLSVFGLFAVIYVVSIAKSKLEQKRLARVGNS